jgi:hypothetical protein
MCRHRRRRPLGCPGEEQKEGGSGRADPSASRRSIVSVCGAEVDVEKWAVPIVRPEDIEICRGADGSPVELGRGGFCKVAPMLSCAARKAC